MSSLVQPLESPADDLAALSISDHLVDQLRSQLTFWRAPEKLIDFVGAKNARSRIFVLECTPPHQPKDTTLDTTIARSIAGELDWRYCRTTGAELVAREPSESRRKLQAAVTEVERNQPVVWHLAHLDSLLWYRPELIMNKLLTEVEPGYDTAAPERRLIAVISVADIESVPHSYRTASRISPVQIIRP
jgi:hypothetical protein